MPKTPINYANSVIYKISCRDPHITDCYVGSTSNLRIRRSSHKTSATKPEDSQYHRQVYCFIREHGGWDNWELIPLELYPCKSKIALEIRERHWITTLGSTLNNNLPASTAMAGGTKEYKHLHYETHKNKYAERRRRQIANLKTASKVECPCGSVVRPDCLTRHRLSKKHMSWMQSTTLASWSGSVVPSSNKSKRNRTTHYSYLPPSLQN